MPLVWWSKIVDNRPGSCSSKKSSVWFHGSEKTFWPTTVMNTISVMLLKQKKNIQISWNSKGRREELCETRNELGIQTIKYGKEIDLFQWEPTKRWKRLFQVSLDPSEICKLLVVDLTFFNNKILFMLLLRLGSISAALSCLVYPRSFPEQRLVIEPILRFQKPFFIATITITSLWNFVRLPLSQLFAPNKPGLVSEKLAPKCAIGGDGSINQSLSPRQSISKR